MNEEELVAFKLALAAIERKVTKLEETAIELLQRMEAAEAAAREDSRYLRRLDERTIGMAPIGGGRWGG